MNDYLNEPAEDPQDRFCKSVAGRIAGGLVMGTRLHDLIELRRWLDDIIEHRDAPLRTGTQTPF